MRSDTIATMRVAKRYVQVRLLKNWQLAATILPLVLLAVVAKIVVRHLHLEILTLSSLFSAVIGATVFLLGFMIAGTLSDFKESERLPTDFAASLYSIADECSMITGAKGRKAAQACLQTLDRIASAVLVWLRDEGKTEMMLAEIATLNQAFAGIEPYLETTFLSRLKGEQNQLRRVALRMQVIRETTFIGNGYAIAELSTLLVIVGLIFTLKQPLFEACFFIGFITFVLSYMIALITDLDNPFNYSNVIVGDEVSLKSLEQFRAHAKSLPKAR